jgi:Dinucleotide-utilizing enzymes involved in molybdopterin and thiamine biosynthesis family 2
MERYLRQTLFQPLGESGQKHLQKGRVLIVGCGALGGIIADLLVRAGVGKDNGRITLVDPDVVQITNVHRQLLFTEDDARHARLKVEAGRKKLLEADAEANIDVIPHRFDEQNASMLADYDVLVDATDNFPTRFLMNRAAITYEKPFVTAGVAGAFGQTMTILPGKTACLECFLQSPETEEQSDSVFPVLGPLPQIFGALEALEAMKILSGHLESVNRSLFTLDLWSNRDNRFDVPRNENCPACGKCVS